MGRRSSNLRPKILRSARAMLLEDGYQALSMRKLAGRVGCTATSIYLHFANKDQLLHSLIDDGIGRLYDCLRNAVQQNIDARSRLVSLCRAYLEFGIDNPEYYEIMFQLHPSRMARYPADKYRRARQNLEIFVDILAERADRPERPNTEDRLRANTIWSNLHGAVSLLLAGRIDARLNQEHYLSVVVEESLRGL